MKILFVVEMLRYNSRENHSYTIGIYDDELKALTDAWEHMRLRAGKYGAEVTGYELNTSNIVYTRTLDSWDAFAESCKDTAAQIRKILDSEDHHDADNE